MEILWKRAVLWGKCAFPQSSDSEKFSQISVFLLVVILISEKVIENSSLRFVHLDLVLQNTIITSVTAVLMKVNNSKNKFCYELR